MKKIILALLMGFCFLGAFGQVDPVVRSVRFEAQSEVEMNAIPSNKLQQGSVCYRSDTNSLWRYNGTTWAEMTGSGLQSTDIDTFDELDAIVVDATLAKSGDNVSIFTNDSFVDLTSNQTIGGGKTFSSQTGHNQISLISGANNIVVGALDGSSYFLNPSNPSLFNANFSLGLLTSASRTYSFPDASGTFALTSNIPDNTDFVDLTSNQTVEGLKTITSDYITIDNTLGGLSTDDSRLRIKNSTLTQSLESAGFGGIYFLDDIFRIAPSDGVSSAFNLGFDVSALTATQDMIFTDTDITWNGTSLLSGVGSSPPFDDNSALVRNNVDTSKLLDFDLSGLTTATTRTLTIPDADVDLGQVVVGPASATDNAIARFDATTGKIIQNSTATLSDIGILTASILTASTRYQGADQTDAAYAPGASSGGIMFINNGMRLATGTNTNNLKLTYGALTSLGTLAFTDSDVTWNGSSLFGTDDQTASEVNITDTGAYYTGTNVEAALQEIGADLASTVGDPDQTLSLGGTGNKDLTISGTGGNTIDLTGVDGVDPDNIESDLTGQPTGSSAITNMVKISLADYNAGTPVAGTDYLVESSPAEVVATATIAMDGWKMYDDQTADAATITLSDCDPGETLTVYINRASAPTLAGTGLTFNQLPNTTAFAAATTMMIIFEVAYDGTTIDYYYVER